MFSTLIPLSLERKRKEERTAVMCKKAYWGSVYTARANKGLPPVFAKCPACVLILAFSQISECELASCRVRCSDTFLCGSSAKDKCWEQL